MRGQKKYREKAKQKIGEFTGKWRFLSNFYPVPVKYAGIDYPSVENAYQAAKTLDLEDRVMFQTCTASQAKKWGSASGRIKIQANWNDQKVGLMRHLLRKKFAEYPLKLALLSTGEAELAEGNWWGDEFWGEVAGKGQNMLGKLLMEIRSELKP